MFSTLNILLLLTIVSIVATVDVDDSQCCCFSFVGHGAIDHGITSKTDCEASKFNYIACEIGDDYTATVNWEDVKGACWTDEHACMVTPPTLCQATDPTGFRLDESCTDRERHPGYGVCLTVKGMCEHTLESECEQWAARHLQEPLEFIVGAHCEHLSWHTTLKILVHEHMQLFGLVCFLLVLGIILCPAFVELKELFKSCHIKNS